MKQHSTVKNQSGNLKKNKKIVCNLKKYNIFEKKISVLVCIFHDNLE